jgi:phage terminase large subunit
MTPAGARIAEWRDDIVFFVRSEFQAEPDRWQTKALLAFANAKSPIARRIAMKACAGPGKSTVMAWCGWWFLATQGEPGHHPVGYAVSITGDNLKDNLWKEFAVWQAKSPFLMAAFTWTAEKIFANDHPATWWIKARKWSKTADPEAIGRTLSGLHGKYIVYLIDESGDIPVSMLRTAEQGLGNCEWGKILTGGNTTSQQGLLYEAAVRQATTWTVITVTADPDDLDRTPRVPVEYAREMIAKYGGRENAWVMAFILGQFPASSMNTLLSVEEVEAAAKRSLADSVYSNIQKRLGIDVARFGDDSTVISPRQGLRAFDCVQLRNQTTPAIAARVVSAKAKWRSELEFIDNGGGWAAGVIDQCALGGLSLVPVDNSGSADDPRYFNKRSEIYFRAAEWVKSGGWIPESLRAVFVREATAPLYWFEGGKFRVEEKKQTKKRIGYSPDHWDAFTTTFAYPDMPASVESMLGLETGAIPGLLAGTSGKMQSEWDPFSEPAHA